MNFLSGNPDVCVRIAKQGTILNDVVEKLLIDDVESKMRACPRTAPPPIPPATFEDDFGSLLQFVSTILLYEEHIETKPPRLSELTPKLRTWKKTYKNSRVKTIANASDRLIDQIQGMDPVMIAGVRSMQARSMVCGFERCGKRNDLTACASCRVQRYCGREHQKKDWKYHKLICDKGLVEEVWVDEEEGVD